MPRLLATTALAWCFTAASAAAAQNQADPFTGKTIVSVRLEVEGQPERSPTIVAQVETVAGRPLRPQDVRTSITNLFRVGRYDDISVLVTDVPGGVDVLYAITPNHPVDKVAFTGTIGMPEGTLQGLLRQQFNGAPAATRANAAVAVIENALRDEGYLRPRVDPSIVPTHNPDRATMVFHIEAGPRARLGTVTVTLNGRAPLTKQAVISRTGAVEGAPYSPRAMGAALDAIRDDLRQQNYYEASRNIRAEESPDGTAVNVELIVSSGNLFRIVFANPGELPKGDRADLVPVKRQRSVDRDLLDDSDRRMIDLLVRDGYWQAQVTHTVDPREDETVVTFTVRRGLRYRTVEPEVTGNEHIPTAELMSTTLLAPPTSAYFDQARLDRWRAGVFALYRARGYAFVDVKFDPLDVTRTEPADGFGHVRMRLVIVEGPETRVGPVTFHTAAAISETDLRGKMKLHTGDLFVRTLMDADQLALQTLYLDKGFRLSRLTITPAYSSDHATAALTVEIEEGPQTIVDSIVIVGSGPIKESTVRSQMAVQVGAPYSLRDEFESRRRLAELQLFRTLDFSTVPVPGSDSHVELIVRVEPAAATTIALGGGLSIAQRSQPTDSGVATQRTEFAPRAAFDISRRNLFGRNRQLSLTSSATFRPIVSGSPTEDGTGFSLGEYHLGGTYRAPQALGLGTDLAAGVSFEKAPRSTFTFVRNTLHADVQKRTDQRISFIGRYTLEKSKVSFGSTETALGAGDLLLIDRLFSQVRLSTVSGGMVRDRRDDLVDPSHGTFLSLEGDLAARGIGSQVGFVKGLVDVSGFKQVAGPVDRRSASTRPRVVLAGRVELGLAHGFGRDVTTTDANGVSQTQHVEDLPASQRFFAGGGTTVRGFDIDQLGTAGVLDQKGLSNGGNGLILFNGEVRTTVLRDLFRKNGDFGVAAFTDAGNVFAKASDVNLNNLLATMGAGVRWKSPLGMLRIDYAIKLNPRTINGSRERRTGWSFSIGEAF